MTFLPYLVWQVALYRVAKYKAVSLLWLRKNIVNIYGVQFPPKLKLRIKHCTFEIYAYFTIEHSSLYFVELTLQFNIVLLSFIFCSFYNSTWYFYHWTSYVMQLNIVLLLSNIVFNIVSLSCRTWKNLCSFAVKHCTLSNSSLFVLQFNIVLLLLNIVCVQFPPKLKFKNIQPQSNYTRAQIMQKSGKDFIYGTL